MERLFSIDEVAEVLRVSHWTVRNWIRTGRLRSAKVGGRRVLRESAVLALIVDDPLPAKSASR